MQVSSGIFKAYDIRGIVPSTINAEIARGSGRAFGTVALAEGSPPLPWGVMVA